MRSNGLSSVMQQQGTSAAVLGVGPTAARMLKTNGAITSGLGRRAITQLDMSAAARLALSSSRPPTTRQPSIPSSANWLPQERDFQFPVSAK